MIIHFVINKSVNESALRRVFLGEYLALVTDNVQQISLVIGDKKAATHRCFGKICRYTFKETVKANLLLCGYLDGVIVLGDIFPACQLVALVEHVYSGNTLAAQLVQQFFRNLSLSVCVIGADVDDVQDNIRIGSLFKSALERLNQIVGQPPDKTYSVRQKNASAVGQLYRTGGYVQGCKELIFRQNTRIGKGVEQRGLAHVGVANNGSCDNSFLFAPVPDKVTALAYLFKVASKSLSPAADMSPVGLKVGLAGACCSETSAQS